MEAHQPENSHPIEVLSNLIGTWSVYSDGSEVSDSAQSWRWGNGKNVLITETTLLDGNALLGERKAPHTISTGAIGYHPIEDRLVGYTFQTIELGDKSLHFVYSSKYWTMDDQTIIRIYTVHYPNETPRLPLPEENGNTRTYRETYKFVDNNTIQWNTDILNAGEWEAFGPNPNGSILRRQ